MSVSRSLWSLSLALLAVLLLSAVLVLAIAHFGLLPVRDEYWVNLDTAIYEKRLYVCDVLYRIERREICNLLSNHYMKLTGKRPGKENWVMLMYLGFKFRKQDSGNVEGNIHFNHSFGTMNELLGGYAFDDAGNPVTFTPAALDEVVLTFMELLGTCSDPESLCDYSAAVYWRVVELGREVTPDDLIPASTWLADPDPWHYHGSDRIY